MSLEEELKEERARTELERIKAAVREELRDPLENMESRIIRAIAEKNTRSPNSNSSQVSDRLIAEVHSDLASGLSNLLRLFTERFPPARPKGRVRRVLQFVGEWYHLAILAVLILFTLALKLHWPWFFAWFGYRLDHVQYPKDLRDVFLIP